MLKIGTLFSGIGAPEEALRQLNVPHEIVFACDIDPYAKKTYLNNFSPKIYYNNIYDVTITPPIDLLVFGFPCQPFSLAGKRRGLQDEQGRIVEQAIRILKNSQPKYFIAENVYGLLSIDAGETFKQLLNNFNSAGYNTQARVLNSTDFGLAQERKRLYFVGTQRSFRCKFLFNFRQYEQKKLSRFLDKTANPKYFATSAFLSKGKVQQKIRTYRKNTIPCITKTIARNGSSSEYISYVAAVHHAIGQFRKPTPRECARLQGFSDKFLFSKISTTQRYNQMANTMSVPILKEIITKLVCFAATFWIDKCDHSHCFLKFLVHRG